MILKVQKESKAKVWDLITRKAHIGKGTRDLIRKTAMWSRKVKQAFIIIHNNNQKLHQSNTRNNLPTPALRICIGIIESKKSIYTFKKKIKSLCILELHVDVLINRLQSSYPHHHPETVSNV